MRNKKMSVEFTDFCQISTYLSYVLFFKELLADVIITPKWRFLYHPCG